MMISSLAAFLLLITTATVRIPDDVTCLAKNVYYEAGAEPVEGQIAVAMVTVNRVKHSAFPSSVCGVVYQRNPRGCQFSWVCETPKPIPESRLTELRRFAKKVLDKQLWIPELSRALYFHNPSVTPLWAADLDHVATIGGHLFYSPQPKAR